VVLKLKKKIEELVKVKVKFNVAMLFNLHIQLQDKIQLGGISLELLTRSKLPGVIDLFKINLQPQIDHITRPYDVHNIWTINGASRMGCIYVLDWWLKAHQEFNLELRYDEEAIEHASDEGQVKVLDWWLKSYHESGLELKYDCWPIDQASQNNKIDLLDWWLKAHHEFDLEFKYSDLTIYWAYEYGTTKTQEWWTNSGLKLSEPWTRLTLEGLTLEG